MALPIRLIVGPDNLMEIPLEAQSLDIVVNRNASAFPTPNNLVGRVAIDTNVPEVDIEIGGILQDDNVVASSIEQTLHNFAGGDIVFNFASIMPTSNLSTLDTSQAPVSLNFMRVDFKDDLQIQNDSTDFIDNFDTPSDLDPNMTNETRDIVRTIRDAGPIDTVDHPSAGTFSAGSTSITVDDIAGFFVKDRVHLQDGTFVGTITGTSSNTLQFNDGTKANLADGVELYSYRSSLWNAQGQIVGSVIDVKVKNNKIQELKLDNIAVPIYENVDYYLTTFSIPPIESLLHNKKISLFPNYWRIDGMSSTRDIPLGVHLVFDSSMAHSDFQGISGIAGAYPSVTNRGRHNVETDANGNRIAGTGNDVYLKLPIGGISTNSVNGNPASTLALIVKKALELTDDVMLDGDITSAGGQTLVSAFTVSVGGPMLKVKQNSRPISFNHASVLEPCLQFDASENFIVTDEGTVELASIEFFTSNYIIQSVSTNSKSAGDKVQDLLGIISNAKKNRDLIRGIQIPYDSLIQSDAVTPTARNFFLTFGRQDSGAKGSENNTLSASHKMMPGLLPGDLGGEPLPDRGDSFFDNIAEFGDAVRALSSFVGNFIGDTFVTLLSDPKGNDGGIRIIPEKFHVRYDAGNNYYAFNLRLKASDFVIGV
tara:strand:+ start:1995 stop:3950 length:1956 start_codon:yes stop_codon:yes gene_type:complete